MGVEFFHRQCSDEAGHASVKLQKVIVGMFFLCLLWTILGFIYVGLGFGSWVFWFGFIGYFDFFCGFYGAYKRSHSLLTIFLILTIIAICFYCFYIIFFIIQAIGIAQCTVYNNCYINGNVTSALVVLSIQLIASIIIWFLAIYACVLCGRLRRLLYAHIHIHYDQVSQVTQVPTYGYQQQPQVIYQQQPQVIYQQPPPVYTQQPVYQNQPPQNTVYRQV